METAPYKHALVLGLGVSGAAAAELLLGEGARVTVVDRSAGVEVRERGAALERAGAQVLTGIAELPAGQFDVCIVSPGIPVNRGWVPELERKGVPVISELDLGGSRCRCRCLAVTGTNGKSTLTGLCAEALSRAGLRTAAGGNYGVPLCRLARQSGELDWIVAEVSSFQLERTFGFHPLVGVLLNLQPDHLDRHGDMLTYMKTKARLFENMTAGDTAIIPAALSEEPAGIVKHAASAAGRRGVGPDWLTFGTSPDSDIRLEGSRIHLGCRGGDAEIDLAGSYFDNSVLGLAAAAGAGAVMACRADPRVLEEAVRNFKPLPHRMTKVLDAGGICFVDDSKATNLSALGAALRMADRPVRLIAGGLLKEADLKRFQEILVKKVCALYVIGKAAAEMDAAWGEAVPCRRCGTLERAVREAWREARDGEMILLSPGCASFDQFRDFEDRGNQFIRIARSINEET